MPQTREHLEICALLGVKRGIVVLTKKDLVDPDWLDLVRYADTRGYHGDQHQDISPYRDYVIEAFNKNKPFDQFTREQLAGVLGLAAAVEADADEVEGPRAPLPDLAHASSFS